MNQKQLAKLKRAYALIVAYDEAYGTDDELAEVNRLISSVIGEKATREAQELVEKGILPQID